jgi:hypothetical protein
MDQIHKSAVRWFIAIVLIHSILLITCGAILYWINSVGNVALIFWINVSLSSFIGSLLYFSRKAYVYLITGKVERIERQLAIETFDRSGEAQPIPDRIRNRLAGYYSYLLLRPIGGLAIGPAITMLILGGLSTLSKTNAGSSASLSEAGLYVVMLMAFAGGYTSSDIFDYLSKLSKALFAKDTQVE